jgi:hypothetical protein
MVHRERGHCGGGCGVVVGWEGGVEVNREIKFRAWNKAKKVMVYKNEDFSSDYWDGVDCSDVQMVNNRFKNDDYEWMQYTGLRDKNGKEIYEGDIVNSPGNVVEFSFGCFNVNGDRCLNDWRNCEVIGNIHNTPVDA